MALFLVTGGAGFIGSHLVEALVHTGRRVRVLDNFTAGRRAHLAAVQSQIEIIEGDAADPTIAARAVAGVDGVFHLAAIPSVQRSLEDPLGHQRSGEVALLTVLHAAQNADVRRLVFASSAAIYGQAATVPVREDLPARPASYYGLSKFTGEEYCRLAAELNPSFDTVSLRFFNVFGPRQDPASPYSGVISIFLRRAQEGRRPVIFGDGRQTRDFVEVTNIVQANLLAMDSPRRLGGAAFNVATGQAIDLGELWREIAALAGVTLEPEFAAARPGDIRHSVAAIERIREVLGYTPSVSCRDGLRRLWESVRHGA